MSMESINGGVKPVFRFLIGPSFPKVKKTFWLSFENNAVRTAHTVYFLSKERTSNYSAIIDGRIFLTKIQKTVIG